MRFVPSYAFHEDVEEIYLCDIHDLLAFLLPYHRAYHYECDFPPGRERTVNRADYRDTMSKFTVPNYTIEYSSQFLGKLILL